MVLRCSKWSSLLITELIVVMMSRNFQSKLCCVSINGKRRPAQVDHRTCANPRRSIDFVVLGDKWSSNVGIYLTPT